MSSRQRPGARHIPAVLALFVPLTLLSNAATLAAEPGNRVQIESAGVTLNGWWTEVDDPRATVLMVHGTLAHANMEIMTTLAEVFAEHAIESLRVSLSLGIDDRHGMLDCGSTQRHRHEDAVDEIAAWFRWLEQRGRSSVLLLGHSRATNQVTRYAARKDLQAPAALILVAPGIRDADTAARYGASSGQALAPLLDRATELVESGQGDEVLGRVAFLHCDAAEVTAASFLSYYADDPAFDTLGLAASAGIPVIVFAGSEDPLSRGVDAAIVEYQQNAPVDFVMIDGADHFFRDLYAYDLVEAVQAWIDAMEDP